MTQRKYQLKKRAERQEETRQRIIDAAIELHQTVGAKTTISAIAERAGVERLTVYRHFTDEWELVKACTGHYYALHPQPEPAQWQHIDDPIECLRAALRDIYAYHRSTEAMSASARRDAEGLPELQALLAPYTAHWLKIRDMLVEKFSDEPAYGQLLSPAIGHALDFLTWRSLIREQELNDEQVIELMVSMVRGLTCS
jgi:AcrR family transcriptional regulator